MDKSTDLAYNISMIYDRFQQESIDFINQGFSVIVSAPTGAGKTAIAEHVINQGLLNNTGVIYTAPIKALSNQKFRDFQNQFSESIGILTGDVSLNPQAPVLIMTTEIFRNKILDEPKSLNKYNWIIYDEIHYIDNPERGTVWEESLMFLPKHMRILGLSATIPNIKEFAAWIESIHKHPVKVVIEDKRPVPLHFYFQCGNQIADNLNQLKRMAYVKSNKLARIIDYVREREGFPCIYFVFGRKRAEDLACETSAWSFLKNPEKDQISDMFEELCRKFNLTNEKSASQMQPLIRQGIAYHHAGMLPTLKEVIERLFTSRLLKVIFTTETFALGINMPSRTVIFDDLRKYYGKYVRNLKTRDFYQMAGRAGRRGIDTEGFVYCRINPQRIRIEEVKQVIYNPPEKVSSQFNISYATILNLYEKYGNKLSDIYPLTLHYFQTKKNQQTEALRLLDAKLNLLKNLGFIEGNALSAKGKFGKTVYGYELMLSELYSRNIFEQLDEFELGILAVSTIFEPRKNQEIFALSKSTRRIRSACEEIYKEIRDKELKHRIYPISKCPYFHMSQAMEYWLRGTEFGKLVRFTDTDEGEIVRYFRMSIQVLREIHDNPVASEILKQRIKETIRVINRDVVDAEKQLREG
ncbi:MAG: DEAD/DEAH box helicase [Candidatus Omnitrophica bacterium]|nr:DEAD/DEAH box helicase [Candidatus Omnitrophota bacterium]